MSSASSAAMFFKPPAPPEPPAWWHKQDLQLVAKAVVKLSTNAVMQHLAHAIMETDWHLVKEWSHQGMVSFRGIGRDIGNKAYSAFWILLVAATSLEPCYILKLSQSYPAVFSGKTKNGVERAGDFLEATLAYWHSEHGGRLPFSVEEHREFSDQIHCGLRAVSRLLGPRSSLTSMEFVNRIENACGFFRVELPCDLDRAEFIPFRA